MNLTEFVKNYPELEYNPNANLTRLTTMKLVAFGDLIIVKSIDSLQQLLKYLAKFQMKYRIIGWGANQVFPSDSKELYLKLELPWDSSLLNDVHDEYHLSASTPLNVLTAHALKYGISGWEVFTGVPASLGGAIAMNAGTNLGEIGTLVKNVKVMTKNGEIKNIIISQNSFKYRGNNFISDQEIIIEATLVHHGVDAKITQTIKNYLDLRTKTQPLTSKTCGCVFKNYSKEYRAGQMIDLLGIKGLTLNGLKISHKHANFIENQSEASSKDFFELTNYIKSELELNFGVKFEFEVKID
jgi:UDP-N-acetylmuramate dehydrogenase